MRNQGGLRNHYVAFLKKHACYGIGDRPYKAFQLPNLENHHQGGLFHFRLGMLVYDSEWEISYRGHFTHMAEITCPYGTMTLTVCKEKIFRDLIEDYSIYSYGKIKIVLEY